MKKIIALILTTFFIASCSSDELIVDVQEEEIIPTETESEMAVEVEPVIVYGDMGSRSAIYYDKLSAATFNFEWNAGESLGVFAYGNDVVHRQHMKFNLADGDDSEDALYRKIVPEDDGFSVLTQNTSYVAYFPYSSTIDDYANIPIDYSKQVQIGHVDMSVYLDLAKTTDATYSKYIASERSASSHLAAYDYLCTAPQTTNYKKGINFSLKRVGSISRFYIKFPKPYVYDSLQIYNPHIDFTITATMDASKSAADALTSKITRHVMSLEFSELASPEHGFDLTLGSDGKTPVDKTFYDYYNGVYSAYLVAYLMMAPTDFSQSSEYSTLYLFAHEKGHPEKKHYFKTSLTTKPNIACNVLYRWTLNRPDVEQPIEFIETTVEDWQQTTGFDNGDSGSGTQGW